MNRAIYVSGLVVAFLTTAVSASQAAVVTRTYDISASDFIDGYGNNPPISSVTLDFTVTFDDSNSFTATTNELTINENTLPYISQFEYDATNDTLIVATEPVFDHGFFGYQNKPDGYGSIILDATSAAPKLYGLGYDVPDGTAGGYVWVSRDFSLTASALTPGNPVLSPVPLPASAPMFGAALMALGVFGYGVKRKKAAAAA